LVGFAEAAALGEKAYSKPDVLENKGRLVRMEDMVGEFQVQKPILRVRRTGVG